MLADDFMLTLTPSEGRGSTPSEGRGSTPTRTAAPRRPYHRQIFEGLREAILDGRLRPGDRLPATRELASALGVARNTAARAYEDLLAGGYLEARVGAGTFVSSGIRPPLGRGSTPPLGHTMPQGAPAPARAKEPHRFDFLPGIPDWDAFPRALWHRLLGRALRARASELRRYGDPAGYFPLRAAIARHLAVSRGTLATPEQVVIVSGSQQALDLIARMLLSKKDVAAVEDPGYPEARRLLSTVAARLHAVPVDAQGMVVERLTTAVERSDPKLVYVTPSHQFPTGATLSLARRLALLDWAGRHGSLIIEDDYDSEFRAPGRTVESLQGLDRGHRVIYIGTFSTVLFPPLRVGYVVLPPSMVEPFVLTKWQADRQTPTLEQLALTDFILEGHFERHLRRMRRLVASRRQAMRQAIADHLGDATVFGADSGMHLMIRLPTLRGRTAKEVEEHVAAAAAELGIAVYPVAPCRSGPVRQAAFVLGYAAVSEESIREGTATLAAAIRRIYRDTLPGARR